jgi:hypothetical protein
MSAATRNARKAIDAALRALDSVRIDLIASRRQIAEAEDIEAEKTPIRPPSRTDMKAAFANANEHAEKAAAALAKPNPLKEEP